MTAYYRPRTLDDALSILATEPVRVAAGCTDLFPATPAKTLPGPTLDITAIAGLRGIEAGADGWRIGAATTWTDLIRGELPPAFDGLKAAARDVGSVQIQNAGTLAGNLCNASPAADGVPCLLTLDASVEISARHGVRTVPLEEFITDVRQTVLGRDEMVTAILIPPVGGMSRFVKLGARAYLVISIAMVAARLEVASGRVTEAAVAVGSCSAVAVRLPALEAALVGAPVDAIVDMVTRERVDPALSPISDVRADDAYRREAALELVRRALAPLAARGEVAA